MQKNTIKPKLILNGMELKKIPDGIFQRKNLLKVKLIRNNIKNIPKDIQNLSRLETFDISNNNIIHTYTKLFELDRLKILNMNNNKLINLPRQIGKLKKLKKLQLANNFLKKLPDEIEQLQNITELNISYNNFKEFPRQIFKLKGLKSIWIGGNFFEILPIDEMITELPNLMRIYTYSNIRFNSTSAVDHNYKRLSRMRGNTYEAFRNKPKDIIVNQTQQIIQTLTAHIIKDKIKLFFKLLNTNEEAFQKEELVNLYNLQAQWNNLEKDVHANIISKEQEILNKNKIRNGLLQTLMKN